MQSVRDSQPADAVQVEPTADDLAGLFADLKAADRAIRSAVQRVGTLVGSGICERVAGGPLEWAIGMACRMTGADRRMIVAAGETLSHLPTVAQLWTAGLVSWGQVRAITLTVRRLPIAARAEVDARVAASVEAYGGIDAFDPDHLVEAADRAAAECSDARNAERREQRAAGANFLALQQSFDGRLRGWFDYDPVNGAIVINGLDAASPRPQADDDRQPGEPTTRGRQYAEGLVELAAEYLAAGNSGIQREGNRSGKRRRARPLFVGHVQVSDVTAHEGATLELNVRGRLTRITCATMEVLAQDADFKAVLFDGARPLAVSRKLHAEKIPDDVAFAVKARDMGDRFPGSRDPVGHVEVHHFRHREHGGTNDVDNLGSFTKKVHLRRIHGLGWRISIDPATGMITAERNGQRWRSLPRATGLARPPGARPPDRPQRRSTNRSRAPNEPLPF